MDWLVVQASLANGVVPNAVHRHERWASLASALGAMLVLQGGSGALALHRRVLHVSCVVSSIELVGLVRLDCAASLLYRALQGPSASGLWVLDLTSSLFGLVFPSADGRFVSWAPHVKWHWIFGSSRRLAG